VGGAAAAAVIWLIPSDRLTGRSAAAGVAAIGTIGMIGSFLAPFGWGVLKDRTGDYQAGIAILPFMFLLAGAVVLWLRRSERRVAAHTPLALPVDL
jgi:nitrate/nitrite transporter NarK